MSAEPQGQGIPALAKHGALISVRWLHTGRQGCYCRRVRKTATDQPLGAGNLWERRPDQGGRLDRATAESPHTKVDPTPRGQPLLPLLRKRLGRTNHPCGLGGTYGLTNI